MRLIARFFGTGFFVVALAPQLASAQATSATSAHRTRVKSSSPAPARRSSSRSTASAAPTIVQDSIVAEDLGRFPDDNVADSLSHITGITIQRTRGGEGQYVNVRGLGPEFSIVTLNGRMLATDGDGREFAFDVLPSEVISGADVLKSSEAPNLEGSIGGSINLRSARPLDGFGQRALAVGRGRLQRPFRGRRLQGERRLQQHLRRRQHGPHGHGHLPGHAGPLGRRARVLHQPGFAGRVRRRRRRRHLCGGERPARPVLHQLRRAHPAEGAQRRDRRVPVGRQRQLPHDGRRPLHAPRRADRGLPPVLLRRGLDPRRAGRHAPLERRQHHGSLGRRHDDRRAGARDLDHHRASRRRHDAVRLERQLAGERPAALQLRCLHLARGARFRRQGHLGGVRPRRQPRRTRGHEQQRPARHQRAARGRARPRRRTLEPASSATTTSACTTSACRAPT